MVLKNISLRRRAHPPIFGRTHDHKKPWTWVDVGAQFETLLSTRDRTSECNADMILRTGCLPYSEARIALHS